MASHGDEIAEQAALPRHLLDELGVVPSSYLQYFYRHDAILAGQLEGTPRAEVVAEIERGLLELYRDPTLNEKPALLEQRGGAFYSEAATGLVTSLVTGDGAVHEVDCATTAPSPALPTTTWWRFPPGSRADGSSRSRRSPLAPELLGLTQHVAAYERLAAQAAVTGDIAIARKALLAHPLIGQHPLNEELVESLLAAETARLPRSTREALA